MHDFARTDASPVAEWSRTIDSTILLAVLLLLAFGFILSLATGPVAAHRIGQADPFHFVYRHTLFAAVSFCLLLAVSFLDETWIRRIAAVIFLLAIAMMCAVLLVGHETKGAHRWLRLPGGMSLQPSEFAKPALIVLTAWLLSQRRASPDIPWAGIAVFFYALTIFLLVLQPDIGQFVLISAAFISVFFVSGLTRIWIASFAGAGFCLGGLLYWLLPHVRYRVNSFLDPSAHETYQVDTALKALAQGGLWGRGPGEGSIKIHLPDAHTDFVYAVVGEEFGLLACIGTLILYAFICVRGIFDAAAATNDFRRAAGVGLFTLFGMQAAINIGVTLSLLPPKGMTLPFISYGGSSLIGSALTIGFALALGRRRVLPHRPLPSIHTPSCPSV